MGDPLLTRMMVEAMREPGDGWAAVAAGMRAAILDHAVRSCPYWAEAAPPGTPWERIPPLTKATIRARWDDLQARGVPEDQRYEDTTSGSTGEPLRFANDRTAVSAHLASYDALRLMAGVTPETRAVVLVTSRTDRRYPPTWVPYPVGGLVPESVPLLLEHWSACGRYAAQGRSSVFEWIAHQMAAQGLAFEQPPAAVFASQDTLSAAGRNLIARTFGCPVRSWYGGQETCGLLAGTLEDGERYAFNPLVSAVEVVDGEGLPVRPGELGRVLVTDLHNRVCPMIRYDTGDLAIASDERRGAWPVIARLEGRSSEVVHLPSGRHLSSTTIGFWLFEYQDVSDLVALWQCEQVAEDAFRLRVVWRREPTEEDVERVRGALLTGLDPGMRVEVVTVDRLDTLPSGKRWTLRRAPTPVTAG